MSRKISRTVPDVVYHYTTHDAFMSILQAREIWAHDARISNDTRETEYAMGLMVRALEDCKSESGFPEFVKDAYDIFLDPFNPFGMRELDGYLLITSFSEEPNLLSQWRAYAPENGYSLGLNTDHLLKATSGAGFKFGAVEYDLDSAVNFFRKEIRHHIQKMEAKWGSGGAVLCLEEFEIFLSSVLPFVKHPSFAEEKEWRAFKYVRETNMIRFRAGRKKITPYTQLALSESNQIEGLTEVIMGPSDGQHVLSSWTSDYLRQLGYNIRKPKDKHGVRVYVSGSPYRSNR